MLKVTDLSIARATVPVLSGLNLEVGSGEAVILKGPNGAGKTTLLRTLAGLQPPLRGRIEMQEGVAAYASHADGLKSALSVAENLEFWARVHREAGIDAAMKAFDLAPLAGRRAGALSAGQKRRLGLARMLVTGRPLWLMDEPTVSLDREATASFAEIVRRHLSTGGAAIIATHIDLLVEGRVLDVAKHKARAVAELRQDEVFL